MRRNILTLHSQLTEARTVSMSLFMLGKRVVSESWVKNQFRHIQVDENTEHGYLWWLKSFKVGDKKFAAYYMTGTGGSKVLVFPEPEMTVVVTSENFRLKEAHELSERFLSECILASAGQ